MVLLFGFVPLGILRYTSGRAKFVTLNFARRFSYTSSSDYICVSGERLSYLPDDRIFFVSGILL